METRAILIQREAFPLRHDPSDIAIQEDEKKGSIEDRVEDPSTDPIATSFPEMKEKNAEMTSEIATQQRDL